MPSLRPHYFFLLLALPVTLLLTVIIPPFHTPDEHTHFYKALLMAEGHIKAHNYTNKTVGYFFPGEYKVTVDKYLYKSATFHEILHDARHRSPDVPDTLVSFANTSVYPPIAYLPQTGGIALGRAFHLSVVTQLLMARFFAALCWIMLIFFAIRILPIGKWFATGLSVTPVMLTLAASSSNDAITFGFCFLWLALILNYRNREASIGWWQLAGLVVLALILGLSKPPYGLFVLLAFLLPASSFWKPKLHWFMKSALILLMITSLLLWTHYVIDIYIPTSASASTSDQLQYILHHPLQNISALFKALVIPPVSINLIEQLVNPSAISNVHFPKSLIFINLLALLLVFFGSLEKESTILRAFNKKPKAIIFLLLLAISSGIADLVYLSFDPVGASVIRGVNTRYFIPLLYLIIPLVIIRSDTKYFTGSYFQYRKVWMVFSVLLIAVLASLTPLITAIQIYAK